MVPRSIMVWAPILAAGCAWAVAVPLETDSRLFVDDTWIAVRGNLTRTVHACEKLPHPVLEPEYPWECQRVYVYGSAHYDAEAGRFRMWYMSSPTTGERGPGLDRGRNALVLYATSEDGVSWERPRLGLYAFDGSTENNIVYGLDSPSVWVDEQASDPARRYKMLGYAPKAWVAYSPDGIHWRDAPVNPVFDTNDTLTLTRDPRTGEYLALHKVNAEHRGHSRRLVALTTSMDLETWSPSKLVMTPDEKDDAWATLPDHRTEFYNMSAFPYAGQFLGFVTVFRRERRLETAARFQSRDDGPIHAELVHSRDGRVWNRLDERVPIIPNGPSGFDAGCILGVTNTPVVVGDEVWMYYTAITTTHGGAMPEKRISIGRAVWRLDGFVSLDAGPEEGVLETVALEPAGDRLYLNADATDGAIRVEALDADGAVLSGYSAAECDEIRSDSVRHLVKWGTRDRLPSGAPIRLRLRLRNARLYSFALR